MTIHAASRLSIVFALLLLVPASASAQEQQPKKTKSAGSQTAETDTGQRIRWGGELALFRVAARRADDEPARFRHYEMNMEIVPGAFGFSVFWESPDKPWRRQLKDGGELQLVSAAAILLVEKGSIARQSSISIGLGLGLIDRLFVFGFLFDLYRGIPTQGSDGERGGGTAETGLLAWAWGRQGEVTPENVSFVINLGLSELLMKLGTGKQ